MLNPFQIRDLHRSQAEEKSTGSAVLATADGLAPSITHHDDENKINCHGTVQISPSDYDAIASKNPRARLTYVDDDDGEVITVGSSFELSQRLDENLTLQPHLQSVQLSSSSRDEYEPMHIFDIRRSNSVTELWKKFECNSQPIAHSTELDDAEHSSEKDASSVREKDAAGGNGQSTSASTEPSEPLLAAFEAELARILHATPEEAQGDLSCPTGEQERTTSSDAPQNPAAAFSQAVRNMVHGAQFISSGVRSRIPDLERQLWDIQRAVPGHVETTMQSARLAMEPRVRTLVETLNSAAVAADERSSNIARGSPMAATTVNGLRTMASELGQFGHALFTTFETELGYNSGEQEQRTNEESTGSFRSDGQAHPSVVETPANAPITVSDSETHQLRLGELQGNEREGLGLNREETSSERDSKIPGIDNDTGASKPLSQCDPQHEPSTSQQTYHSRPSVPPNHMPYPSFSTFPPPPPEQFHVPPPPPMLPPPLPSMPGPCFQSSPGNPPWSHFPPHPPPPRPHPFHHRHHPRHPHPPRHPHHSQPSWRPGWPSGPGPFPRISARGRSRLHALDNLQAHEVANKTLFIGNVGFNVTEDMIRGIFASQGFLVEVHLPVEQETGKHAGFGYLNFPSTHAAKGALEALQGIHIDGHSINLEFSDNSPITSVQTSRHDGPSTTQTDMTSRKAEKLPESRELVDTSTEAMIDSSKNLPTGLNSSGTGAHDPSKNRPGNSGLLGRDNEDLEFSARYPSLVPEPTSKSPRIGDLKPDHVSRLSPELHMDRFPPVSQLDAHMVADQRLKESNREAKEDLQGTHSHPYSARPTARDHDPQLRRAASMVSPRIGSSIRPESHNVLSSGDQLGRRGDRLSRGMKRMSLESNQFGTLGSLPSRVQPPNSTASHHDEPPSTISRIDKCVETLIGLGYGGADEGGHHRLGVYAGAADGKVNDAIEMIEDERKAYEQRKA